MAGIIWIGALLLLVGYLVYRTDKKIKEKYQDTFNPREWDLPDTAPGIPPSPSATNLSPVTTAAVTAAARPQPPAFRRQPQWFSASQIRIHKLLQQALPADYVLLARIQLGDLVTGPAILEDRLRRRVDFVICSSLDLAPLCLVTLEDSAFELRQLEEICRSVQLPLVMLAASNPPGSMALREQLLAAMGVADAVRADEQKSCPLCGAAMRQRQINSGAQAGRRVWVCATYPACKGWLAIA